MSQSVHPESRNFFCDQCGGEIRIPYELPPTKAPCPFCKVEITSPGPPLPVGPVEVGPVGKGEMAQSGAVTTESVETVVSEGEVGGQVPEVLAEVVPAGEVEQEMIREELPVEVRKESPKTERLASPVELRDKVALDEVMTKPAVAAPRGALPAILFLIAALALVGVVVVVGYLLRSGTRSAPSKGTRLEMDDAHFIRDGWMGVATERLRGFLAAEGLEEKAAHVIGGNAELEAMRTFYALVPLDESDTTLDGFSHYSLDLADRERGVFLMRYERPAQYDIREFFRPVAPLEVQYHLEPSEFLMASAAARDNFAMEPVQAMVFFKRKGGELFIDWATYVQTKYRTLRRFCDMPQVGERGVFRVVMQEDIADLSTGGEEATRYYRLSDPGNVKVRVREETELGGVLSELNWIGLAGVEIATRTATVELVWSEGEDPRVELKRVICWEFLGLGGEEGNTVKVVDPVEPVPESAGDEEGQAVPDAAGTPES